MIVPRLVHEHLLSDIREAQAETQRLHLWWLGQSGFLLQWRAHHLLFDPYLSDSLTRKYAQTEKPHVRISKLVIAPDQLDFVDVVTSSHNHTDHLDADTLLPLFSVNPALKLVAPSANREFVIERLGKRVVERVVSIDAGEQASIGPFRLAAVPAAHELLERDSMGRFCQLGFVAQFGDWTVYHSGDTVVYPGMAELLREWTIDIALLPVNGRRPERRVAGNMWGHEAAALAKEVGAKMVIPCHYDLFEFNTVSTDEFEQSCRKIEQPFRILEMGERFSV